MSQEERDARQEAERLREDQAYRRGNPWEGCASGCVGHILGAVLVAVLAVMGSL